MTRPDPHPGIRIDKIPVSGWAGLLFAVGVMLLILLEVPLARWFLLATVPVGVITGIVLYFTRRDR
jgi:hypothetical protein